MAEYEGLNIAELTSEADRLKTKGKNQDFLANFVRMPEKSGFVTVRLLPKIKGKDWYCATRTHKLGERNVHCSKSLSNDHWIDLDPKRPCVICAYYKDLYKQRDKLLKAGKVDEAKDIERQAQQIKPNERYYYNCIVREQLSKKDNKLEFNVGPLILSVGEKLHEKIVTGVAGNKTKNIKGFGDVTHPKTGRDFCIRKELKDGPNEYPSYNDSSYEDPTPLGEPDHVTKWMNSMHDLTTLRVVKSVEEMEVLLQKYLDGDVVEEEAYDIGKFRNKKKPTASLEDQVRAADKNGPPAARPTTPVVQGQEPPAPTGSPEDSVVAEQDFLAELREINKD